MTHNIDYYIETLRNELSWQGFFLFAMLPWKQPLFVFKAFFIIFKPLKDFQFFSQPTKLFFWVNALIYSWRAQKYDFQTGAMPYFSEKVMYGKKLEKIPFWRSSSSNLSGFSFKGRTRLCVLLRIQCFTPLQLLSKNQYKKILFWTDFHQLVPERLPIVPDVERI